MPKTVDTRKHCKVGLRACNNLPQPPPYIFVFRGCGRLLHALNPTLQCFLVSTVFGTVSSLHLTSFLMIFTLVYQQPRRDGVGVKNVYGIGISFSMDNPSFGGAVLSARESAQKAHPALPVA